MNESDEELRARLKREQAEREVLKQQLHQAPTLYEWTIQRKRKYMTEFALVMALIACSIGGGIVWYSGMWVFSGIGIMGVFLGAMAKFWGGGQMITIIISLRH